MGRILKAIWILFKFLLFIFLICVAVIISLYYKRINDNKVVAKPLPGTIMDQYEGIWAHSAEECDPDNNKLSRILIDTTGDYARFVNFSFQCDVLRVPNTGDRDQKIHLGCWKVENRTLADTGSKRLRELTIIDRDAVKIDRELFVRCKS